MMDPRSNRDLYDVLGLRYDCSQEEIRSAYRRLALHLHPDKAAQTAGGRGGTAAFQELLCAYEILSDPNERASYNKRCSIVFPDPPPPSSASISRYSFSGFADSGRGFYRVFGDAFAAIYAGEVQFSEKSGIPSSAVPPAPLIGNLDSPCTQVTEFYNYWLGFCTVMDFACADDYDSPPAWVDWRYRRFMEMKNEELRAEARNEYNSAVRRFADAVMEMDKRVLDIQKERDLEEAKRRLEEKRKRKEERNKRKRKKERSERKERAKIDDAVEKRRMGERRIRDEGRFDA